MCWNKQVREADVSGGWVLNWKGERGQGYSWARRNKQVGLVRVVFACGRSFDTGTGTVSWRVEDGGDEDRAADGTHKQQPLGPVFMPTQLRTAMVPGGWNGR